MIDDDAGRAGREGGLSLRAMTVFGFAIAVMVIAGLGFSYKMTEFVFTIIRDDVEGFGAVAVATYLVGMLPLLLLTLWATFTGRFRDIERPKYRVLELDAEIELEEQWQRSRTGR